jgi:uncharacterized protein (DUF1800 family)
VAAAVTDWLAPYEPTAADPFDLAKAGHLLRRAGYGGALAERQDLVRRGVDAAVAQVCSDGDGAAGATDPAERWLGPLLALDDVARLRETRVWIALQGSQPLRDRVATFWHHHFATSNRKLQDPRALARQFATFDRLGLGAFDELCAAMVRDPALLRWLDNDVNLRGKPNENFAREWLELFTLGRGNYTEGDVRGAARACTGYTVVRGVLAFVRGEHDQGEVDFLGARGRVDGDELARRTAAHPASARLLACKWLRWFVHQDPEPAWIDALAGCYQQRQRDVGATLRVLLRSRLFFSPAARRSIVKSPSEFVLGTVRACGGRAVPKQLALAIAAMGEAWAEPATVEGWRGGRAWLTPATWLLRSNFAAELFAGRLGAFAPGADALLAPAKAPADRAQLALDLLLDGDCSPASRERLLAFAASSAADGPGAAGALLHAVTVLPEHQLL